MKSIDQQTFELIGWTRGWACLSGNLFFGLMRMLRLLHNLRFIRLMLKTKGIQAGNPNCYKAFTENELDAFPPVLLFVVLHSLMVNDKL